MFNKVNMIKGLGMNTTRRPVARGFGHRGTLSIHRGKLASRKGLQRGFSLIEMSVYLAVSGLLLSAMVPLSMEVIAKAKDMTNAYESAADRMRVLNGKKPIRPDANPYVIKTLDYSMYTNSAGVDASMNAVNDRGVVIDAAQRVVAAGASGPAAEKSVALTSP
jgi:prepilin-type N-terminal cleavage/methylation domain-containing protein